jgi:hypothetical protein
MAYAIFENQERLTRIFASEQDAWKAAERAGLVEIGSDGKKALEDDMEIRFCNGEPEDGDDAELDFIIY